MSITLTLLILTTGCREKYVPELLNQSGTGYLVVEGFINSGTGPTTIALSRSAKISDTTSIIREKKAVVKVEGRTNTTGFALTETSPGIYTHPQLTLDPSDQYRVRITTLNGRQYISDYSAVRKTVDIDSASWREENGGVQIYANSHDPLNKTIYYRYEFDETWEFHSRYSTYLKTYPNSKGELDRVGYRDSSKGSAPDSSLYRCWSSARSFKIVIGSTEKLSQDIMSFFPVQFIEPASIKLGWLYSINLKQYAISREAYRFYDLMKRNTQQLGSIFDAQPSENNGNIHPLDVNSTEPVIGFVEVTQEKQKRIFISITQLRAWQYQNTCDAESDVINFPDSVLAQGASIPTREVPTGRTDLYRVYFAPKICVDCTFRGTNVKPSFWP